jgi:hypothetical protein
MRTKCRERRVVGRLKRKEEGKEREVGSSAVLSPAKAAGLCTCLARCGGQYAFAHKLVKYLEVEKAKVLLLEHISNSLDIMQLRLLGC